MPRSLHSSDPMEVYEACLAVRPEHARDPGLRERLLELLDDTQDADCGNYTCAAAAQALARIDPAGGWHARAAASFRSHIERSNHDQARAIAGAVRMTMPADEYLAWAREALEDRLAQLGRAAASVEWLPGWESDTDIIAALLTEEEESRLWVLRHLLTREAVLKHLLSAEPHAKAARGSWRAELDALAAWTADAPASLREEVRARARETGLA